MSNLKSKMMAGGTNKVLSSITSALVGHFRMDRLLDQVVSTTMEMLHAEVCSIFLLEMEKDKELLVMRAGSGFARPLVDRAKYELGEGFTGYIARHKRGFNIASREEFENLAIDSKHIWLRKHDHIQWPSGRSEFRNLIALPLLIKGQCLGVMRVENKQPDFGGRFSEDDYVYFETIANVVALAIENAKLHKRTENQLKTIAGKAAHRIHNQATNYDGIELFLEAEIEEETGPDPEQLKIILDRLKTTTQNLKRMTDEFKNYGKPLHLELTKVNINKIIEDEIWLTMPPKEIQLGKKLEANLPLISLDAPRFAEAIKELLRNSLKAISKQTPPKGNILISTTLIPMEEVTSDIGQRKGKSSIVRIAVQDDGPGFPPNFPLFEPFHTTDPNSTGLGMATVKELIEAHGGAIRVVPGKGAHIEVELPIK